MDGRFNGTGKLLLYRKMNEYGNLLQDFYPYRKKDNKGSMIV